MLVLYQLVSVNCVTGGNAPPRRSDAAFTTTSQGAVYLFGGTLSGVSSSDFYIFEPFNNTWRQLVNSGLSSPGARSYSTLWMAPDGNIYLYGGFYPGSSGKWGCPIS
jgi:hypothetical protein